MKYGNCPRGGECPFNHDEKKRGDKIRIHVRAKAEVKERREDQDPEATRNHRKALGVLGPARSPERVPGLVEAPLPTLEVRSAKIM